jgi:hypothetical protein
MAKKHHNKGTEKLKKIIAEAKRLRVHNKGKKWTTLVKEASKKLK